MARKVQCDCANSAVLIDIGREEGAILMANSPRGSCRGSSLVILATLVATLAGSARASGAEPQSAEPRQIVVRLSRDVFDSLVEDQVDRTTDVTDVILGANVRGRARTRGAPKLDLIPDSNRG